MAEYWNWAFLKVWSIHRLRCIHLTGTRTVYWQLLLRFQIIQNQPASRDSGAWSLKREIREAQHKKTKRRFKRRSQHQSPDPWLSLETGQAEHKSSHPPSAVLAHQPPLPTCPHPFITAPSLEMFTFKEIISTSQRTTKTPFSSCPSSSFLLNKYIAISVFFKQIVLKEY